MKRTADSLSIPFILTMSKTSSSCLDKICDKREKIYIKKNCIFLSLRKKWYNSNRKRLFSFYPQRALRRTTGDSTKQRGQYPCLLSLLQMLMTCMICTDPDSNPVRLYISGFTNLLFKIHVVPSSLLESHEFNQLMHS